MIASISPFFNSRRIESFDTAVNDYINDGGLWTESQKSVLKGRVKLLVEQAAVNCGLPSWIHPARFTKSDANDIAGGQVLEELKAMIVRIGAPNVLNDFQAKGETGELFAKFILGRSFDSGDFGKTFRALPALLWDQKKKDEVLNEAKGVITDLLSAISTEIEQTAPSDEKDEAFHYQAIIFQLLSYYVFLDPKHGDPLSIPLRVEGEWKTVDYTVEKIDITPDWLGSHLFAFGFKPTKSDANAPALLVFKGTTYPSDDGFLQSMKTDTHPFDGVGGDAFDSCRRNMKIGDQISHHGLESWLKDNHEAYRHKVVVAGHSLGGSLAEKTETYFPEHVDAHVIGAPGLCAKDKKEQKLQKKNNYPAPSVENYWQHGDPIPLVDRPGRGNFYKIIGNDPNPHFFMAHVKNGALHKEGIILRIKAEQEAKAPTRHLLTALKQLLSFPFYAFFSLLIAFVHAVNALKRGICRPFS